jgi:hypothetical protein
MMEPNDARTPLHEESKHPGQEPPVDARLQERALTETGKRSRNPGGERSLARSPLTKEEITFTVTRTHSGFWHVQANFSKFDVKLVKNLSEVTEAMMNLWEQHVAD